VTQIWKPSCSTQPSSERIQALEKRGDQEQAALGQSKGDFTTKIHVLTDAIGNRLRVCLTGRHRHDVTQAIIPVKCILWSRSSGVIWGWEYDKDQYKKRHLIECFFGKLKQYRRVFSRFEQLARNFLAFVHLACSIVCLH
jgi:transposase